MELNKLIYHKPAYPLNKIGVLVELDGDEIVREMQGGFDTYIEKWIDSDDDYDYYVTFRVGYVGFVAFYKKLRSLQTWFHTCKDYCITRIAKDGTVEITDCIKNDHEQRQTFTDKFGPRQDSFYDENIYTDYAKQMAETIVK